MVAFATILADFGVPRYCGGEGIKLLGVVDVATALAAGFGIPPPVKKTNAKKKWAVSFVVGPMQNLNGQEVWYTGWTLNDVSDRKLYAYPFSWFLDTLKRLQAHRPKKWPKKRDLSAQDALKLRLDGLEKNSRVKFDELFAGLF